MHETDVTSLVFGLVFIGLTVVWAMVELGVLTVSVLPLAVPVVLVVVGVIGVAFAVNRSRQDQSDEAF